MKKSTNKIVVAEASSVEKEVRVPSPELELPPIPIEPKGLVVLALTEEEARGLMARLQLGLISLANSPHPPKP